jgi:peroxiredoxin
LKARVCDEAVGRPNPSRCDRTPTSDIFGCKRVALFSFPGTFTPTCSTYHLPDFERLAAAFKDAGIDENYCISVNDAFLMNAWGKQQDLKTINLIPDGSGEFTR